MNVTYIYHLEVTAFMAAELNWDRKKYGQLKFAMTEKNRSVIKLYFHHVFTVIFISISFHLSSISDRKLRESEICTEVKLCWRPFLNTCRTPYKS